MPYEGARAIDDFFLPFPLAIWTSSAPAGWCHRSRKVFVTYLRRYVDVWLGSKVELLIRQVRFSAAQSQ